jgi:AcrR family transcriptional regulator
MGRKYEMKRRAENVRQTRARIVEATIELHGTVGPARTTQSAIADRAGVERQTYYRHFPDDRSLFEACTGLYMERNPVPDSEPWAKIEDAQKRLGRGLSEIYRYYESNAEMLRHVIRDAAIHPLTAEMVDSSISPAIGALRSVLASGFSGERASRDVEAAISLAVDFNTWRLLTEDTGLSRKDAVRLMASLIRCAI